MCMRGRSSYVYEREELVCVGEMNRRKSQATFFSSPSIVKNRNVL